MTYTAAAGLEGTDLMRYNDGRTSPVLALTNLENLRGSVDIFGSASQNMLDGGRGTAAKISSPVTATFGP